MRGFVYILEPFDGYLVRVNTFTLHSRIEHISEGVLSKDAYVEARIGGPIRLPSDKLAEVVEVGGFDLNVGWMQLCHSGRRESQQ